MTWISRGFFIYIHTVLFGNIILLILVSSHELYDLLIILCVLNFWNCFRFLELTKIGRHVHFPTETQKWVYLFLCFLWCLVHVAFFVIANFGGCAVRFILIIVVFVSEMQGKWISYVVLNVDSKFEIFLWILYNCQNII